jgi:hypothetical protein
LRMISSCGSSASALEARVLSKIGFEIGTTLLELNADQGDRAKGQVLASRFHKLSFPLLVPNQGVDDGRSASINRRQGSLQTVLELIS